MAVEVTLGVVFGKLTVVREGPRVPNGAKTARGIVVRCECGSDEFVTNINNLRSGRTTSCGCAKRQAAAKIAASQKGKTREEITDGGRQSNLVGQVFGRLTAVEDLGIEEGYRAYRCACSCGEETVVAAYRLLHDKGPRSCGCLQREAVTKHGMEGTRVYNIWQGMKARCEDPTHKSYPNYGGRGIVVCSRWSESFKDFYDDMSDPPTGEHTLDRLDNDGNYEPSNCRWATPTEQANNRRNSRLLTYYGRTQTLTQWAREYRIHPITLRGRLDRGWSLKQALTTVVNTAFASKARSN